MLLTTTPSARTALNQKMIKSLKHSKMYEQGKELLFTTTHPTRTSQNETMELTIHWKGWRACATTPPTRTELNQKTMESLKHSRMF